MIISIITQMCKKERMDFGMQNKISSQKARDIISFLEEYFNNRIDVFTIFNSTDVPYPMFGIRFTLYNYYNIIFNYDRGKTGFTILNGQDVIGLNNSQTWFDEADLDVLCKELDEKVRLRIPDKYLAYYNWEK